MSLTDDDLAAIKKLIDGSIEEHVPNIVQVQIKQHVPPIVEKHVEAAKRQTAAAIAEVHGKLRDVEYKLDTIGRIQQAEIKRSDNFDKAMSKLRRVLHSA